MANQYFQFKQFTIRQDRCAMKVGTDGVVLGAWADPGNATNILDIGTGTGILALMLAQRSAASITAIEIDASAKVQALENIQSSPWRDRIEVLHSSLQEYVTCGKKYDLIISNPPFFSNSLKSNDGKRNLARHDDSLSAKELLKAVDLLLNETGRFVLILPFEGSNEFILDAAMFGLYCNRKVVMKPTPLKKENRIVMEFSRCRVQMEEEYLVIRNVDSSYSTDYKSLTKDFYLGF